MNHDDWWALAVIIALVCGVALGWFAAMEKVRYLMIRAELRGARLVWRKDDE